MELDKTRTSKLWKLKIPALTTHPMQIQKNEVRVQLSFEPIWAFWSKSANYHNKKTSKTHDYVEKSTAKPPHTWNIEFSFRLSPFEPSKTLYFLSLSGTKLGPFRPNMYYSRDVHCLVLSKYQLTPFEEHIYSVREKWSVHCSKTNELFKKLLLREWIPVHNFSF